MAVLWHWKIVWETEHISCFASRPSRPLFREPYAESPDTIRMSGGVFSDMNWHGIGVAERTAGYFCPIFHTNEAARLETRFRLKRSGKIARAEKLCARESFVATA